MILRIPIFSRFVILALIAGWLHPSLLAAAPEVSAASAPKQLRTPRLSPDYTDLVIPPNIAPLNFIVQEAGTQFDVELRGAAGRLVQVKSGTPSIQFPLKQWRELLDQNVGQNVQLTVSVRDSAGTWERFATVTNFVAREKIDSHLAYRLLGPLYNFYQDVGIYQRNLETFQQDVVLHNSSFNKGCVNCHTFLQNRPDTMALHIREKTSGNPMMLVQSNSVARVDQTGGYLSWHPSGRLLTFSVNKLSLFFHTTAEPRDVYDANSDLKIYRVDSNTVVTPPAIARPEFLETWPGWAPDGKYLYFCRAQRQGVRRLHPPRYDLVRVSYDIDRDRWGEAEVLVAAKDSGLSAAQPRVSPDNTQVLFCLAKEGNFPIYQQSSDIYSFSLVNHQYRRLEINSDQADSWHCWSTSGRWLVFSSKRRDGLFTRPHISYVDEAGGFHKAFILPQEDPAFYDTFLKNYNLPELIQGPVTFQRELARSVLNPKTIRNPTTQDTKAGPNPPKEELRATEPYLEGTTEAQ